MLKNLFVRYASIDSSFFDSGLYNEASFYPAFARDLRDCKSEIIVESPFITIRRISTLLPELVRAIDRGVRITVNTRHPAEHEGRMRAEAEAGIMLLQDLSINVLYTGGHHRKLAIFDRRVLYEGSLNILSQNDSSEIMRRIESEEFALEMIRFTGLSKFCDH